jgi:hypothetical protein
MGHEMVSSMSRPGMSCRPASKAIPPFDKSRVRPRPVASSFRRRTNFQLRSNPMSYRRSARRSPGISLQVIFAMASPRLANSEYLLPQRVSDSHDSTARVPLWRSQSRDICAVCHSATRPPGL